MGVNVAEIVGGILKPVATVFTKRTERKMAKDTIKGKLAQGKQDDDTKIELTDAEWETVNQSMQDKTWKDEYVTVSIVSIFNLIIIGGIAEAFGYSQVLVGVVKAVTALTAIGLDLGFLMTAVVLAAIGMKMWRL